MLGWKLWSNFILFFYCMLQVLSCGGANFGPDNVSSNYLNVNLQADLFAIDQCFELDQEQNVWHKVSPMLVPRKRAESIMIDPDTWWITGKAFINV